MNKQVDDPTGRYSMSSNESNNNVIKQPGKDININKVSNQFQKNDGTWFVNKLGNVVESKSLVAGVSKFDKQTNNLEEQKRLNGQEVVSSTNIENHTNVNGNSVSNVNKVTSTSSLGGRFCQNRKDSRFKYTVCSTGGATSTATSHSTTSTATSQSKTSQALKDNKSFVSVGEKSNESKFANSTNTDSSAFKNST